MPVKGADSTVGAHNTPLVPEHPPTGLFANRKVVKIPPKKTQRFLDFLSHRSFPFKSIAAYGVKKLSSSGYSYMLEKRNPLNNMSAENLNKTIHSQSEHREPVDDFITKKLAHYNLPYTPNDFHTYYSDNLCTFEAVKTALKMLDADAVGHSSLNVPYEGTVSKLPKIARNALEEDLKEHHNLSAQDVTFLMNKNLKLPELRAAVQVCECKTDADIWRMAASVPLKHLPDAKRNHIKEMVNGLVQQSGIEKPNDYCKQFLEQNTCISKESLELFVGNIREQQQHTQEAVALAIHNKDLASLAQVTPKKLNTNQMNALVEMMANDFIMAGMNPKEAQNFIQKTLGQNERASLANIASLLAQVSETALNKIASNNNSRWYQLSDQPLAERCRQVCTEADLEKTSASEEFPNIPPETIASLKKELRRSAIHTSVSDMEVSLEMIARRMKRESPFKAVAPCPLQTMESLSRPAKQALLDFVSEETKGSLENNNAVRTLRSAINDSVFVTDCEAAIREILPERMFRTEALDILGLPAGASEQDVKNRYHQLAFIYHPDKAVGLEAEVVVDHENKFKEINAANARLNQSENWKTGRRPIMPSE